MKSLPQYLFAFLVLTGTAVWSQHLGESYIGVWRQFYPSKALSEGMRASVYRYEDLSAQRISEWLALNQRTLERLSTAKGNDVNIDRIDARLLKVQLQSEIDKWTKLSLHTTSLSLYSGLLVNAINPVLEAEYLLASEKAEIICQRLVALQKLSNSAQKNLKQVSDKELEKGAAQIATALEFLKNDLTHKLQNNGSLQKCDAFDKQFLMAVDAIEALQAFVASELRNNTTQANNVLGREEYDRRLKLYTDSELSSDKLAQMALHEIETVKELMAEVSTTYLKSAYPKNPIGQNKAKMISMALTDMEKDAPLNGVEYLEFWQQLSDAAVQFIKENKIATLPKYQTLRIESAPESAGPAARIGWVASAPPFEPNPMTTLYLPSIPDTLPRQEQIDFWASFNKPFNRMIVIHELYPGHYMQQKVSRESAHPIRLLFPFGIYTEGWATFTEKVILDQGWEAGRPLTLLAHLRKRLENANRSYTSVQVHCNGWTKKQLMEFSTETSLLAPQFAKSLWGRIINSPMQLTSYFLGGAQFTELLRSEKERLGDKFDLQYFMDTIMKAGPIPIDEFYTLFAQTSSN